MGIIPPDPGRSLNPGDAIKLAKSSGYDEKHLALYRDFERGGFVERSMRWLRPDGSRWVATCQPERAVSAQTYEVLRAALDRQPAELPDEVFASDAGGRVELWTLRDDGYEAVAVPA